MKKKINSMVLTNVLSCTTWLMSFKYNKSKQQDGFPCLQGNIFFVHFVLQFFSSSFSVSEVKFPLNVQ